MPPVILTELTYLTWLSRVDRHVTERTGVSLANLPGVSDGNLRDWFDDGMLATQAADRAIELGDEPPDHIQYPADPYDDSEPYGDAFGRMYAGLDD